jgi:Rad3-related DNA helicase
LNQILAKLNKVDVVGVNAPPGYGKSYVARALQIMFGKADIITANNHLLDQYKRDYPELNCVKGKDHYGTTTEYNTAKAIARSEAHSVFNPLSALFTVPGETRSPKCIIVDEAHTLGDMLRHAASISLNASKAGIPKGCTSEYELSRWIQQRFHDLSHRMSYAPISPQFQREYEKVGALYYALVGHEQDSVFHLNRSARTFKGRRFEQLEVDAVDYPTGLIQKVLTADKVVLMSGTLTKTETAALAEGRSWEWFSVPYLAPEESRPVYIQPVEEEDRKNIPKLCEKIRRIYIEGGRKPTLVHVTYGDMNEYKSSLTDLDPITNTSRNKDWAEKRFRTSGGLWLAAGCAEGLDFPGDLCRNVIIPTLQFPNKGDMYVQKRMGKPDGSRWYCLKTLENTIQRLGRGMRGANDHCNHFIFDPYFPRLWEEYGEEFEPLAIKWGYE